MQTGKQRVVVVFECFAIFVLKCIRTGFKKGARDDHNHFSRRVSLRKSMTSSNKTSFNFSTRKHVQKYRDLKFTSIYC